MSGSDCHCFRLCSPTDFVDVLQRLPIPASAVWQQYLRRVYHEKQSSAPPATLLLDLRKIEVLYPALLPTQPCGGQYLSKRPQKCTAQECAQWLRPASIASRSAAAVAARNRSFAFSTDGLRGGAWRTAEFVLSQNSVSARRAKPSGTWVEVVRRATDLSRDNEGRLLFPEGAASCQPCGSNTSPAACPARTSCLRGALHVLA